MNNIYRGLTKTIWGYVFLHLNVNLGTLNVLPDWVGYLLFFSAIILLGEQLRDLTLLKPFCILLGVRELVDWLTVLFTGGGAGGAVFPAGCAAYLHQPLFPLPAPHRPGHPGGGSGGERRRPADLPQCGRGIAYPLVPAPALGGLGYPGYPHSDGCAGGRDYCDVLHHLAALPPAEAIFLKKTAWSSRPPFFVTGLSLTGRSIGCRLQMRTTSSRPKEAIL